MSDPDHLEYLNSQEEFDRFLNDLDHESDRGAVLSASCMIEIQIERCISAYLANGAKDAVNRLSRSDGPLGTFSSRIDLLNCLGVLDNTEFASLHLLRKLRNSFAHELMINFTDSSMSDRAVDLAKKVLNGLNPDTLEKLISKGPRQCFTASVFVLFDNLKLRHALIPKMRKTIIFDFSKMNREIQEMLDSTDLQEE